MQRSVLHSVPSGIEPSTVGGVHEDGADWCLSGIPRWNVLLAFS